MKRLRGVWILFFLGVGLVVAAMAWSSRAVWELERAERRARAQAQQDENLRLALWRMDSTLAPLVAAENTRLPNASGGAIPPAPTGSAADGSPWAQLYFQFDAQGNSTPPQVPTISNEDSAARVDLLQRLPFPLEATALAQNAQSDAEIPPANSPAAEFNRRVQAVTQNTIAMAQNQVASGISREAAFRCGPMVPVWFQGKLLLARRVQQGPREWLQGCVLDWPALRQSLLKDIADLLPQAQLEATTSNTTDDAYRLASLPLRLVPAALPEPSEPTWGPATLSLLAAWAALGLAAASVAALLIGVVRLSERRATFVSAVTHELRTPLTTFQLYSEMLATGMVPEPERPTYLQTLREEAERLTHLVENVLAYARLERGRTSAREEATAESLLGPLLPRLASVAARGAMQLAVEIPPEALACRLNVNRSSLEQIVLNLVDNAAKYAAKAADRRIHLTATVLDNAWELRVWDHGPGLAHTSWRRCFRPFGRSAQEAAGSAPGVGLGLALSRRLALDLGGRLSLDPAFHAGACFVLRLSTRRA